MFTGLVEAVGEVVSLERRAGATRLVVSAGGDVGARLIARLREGDSVAVSGVCLTALGIVAGQGEAAGATSESARGSLAEAASAGVRFSAGRFSADLAEETMARTTLGRLRPGAAVNVELPTPAGAPLGGHVVQGHVDGVGTLV
ncbi:MAG: riboflavin synthase, partial [Acidobacteriota bacterium]|nr:riboflavin synthase [Acidobacteriota bacterium]